MARWLLTLVGLASCDQAWGLSPVVPSTIDCPANYDLHLGTSSYRFNPLDIHWDTAERQCELDGSGITRQTHLAVLGDDSERVGLYSLLIDKGIDMGVWIGFTDTITEGTFLPVTAEPVQQPPGWAATQPDNNGSPNPPGQDCVHIESPTATYPGLLDDVGCFVTNPSVCECDDWAPEPTNF